MIKQLIASTILATSIGIQNATNTSDQINQYEGFYEVQSQNEYNNDILDDSRTMMTEMYRNVWIGSNINVKARAMSYITRNIADNIYVTRKQLILKCNTSLTIDQWKTSIKESAQYSDLLQSAVYSYSYVTNMDNELENWFNGQKFNTYTAMYNFYNDISQNGTFIGIQSPTGLIVNFTNTNYIGNYICIETVYNWDETKITDNGAFIETAQPYTDVKQTIEWQVPAGNQGEIVDIPGMMFTILGMPFAWISTAFNFTIFPGTMYEVNISAILMAIVLGLIVLYIVKKIIK